MLPLAESTTSVENFTLACLRYFGVFGNMIFFICTAYFLLESTKINLKKWFSLLAEVWSISVIILIIVLFARGGANLSKDLILKSFLPITFENNWYITCYLMFYPIHVFLNRLIWSMNQKLLLKCCCSLLVLYSFFDFLLRKSFYSSDLVYWVVIYFVIAYLKYYLKDFRNNRKANVVLLSTGIIYHLGILLLTNYLGFKIPALNGSEYSRAVTPQIRQAGNRLSGLAETAYASLLA